MCALQEQQGTPAGKTFDLSLGKITSAKAIDAYKRF
jgi:hypothetical protein